MLKKLKEIGGKSSSDYVGKIPDSLEKSNFATKEVFSHGLPHHPTALAYDVLQSLVAIGNDKGTVRIFGEAGLEVCLQHDLGAPIKQLIFITNKGYLISVTGNDTINLWSLRQQPTKITHQMKLKKDKVTKCSYTYSSHWLYVGTDKSNIHLVRVEGLALSAYTIPWNEVAERQGIRKNTPGAVVDILEHPLDKSKVLLGYTSGLMVLWNLEKNQVEHRYHPTQMLESLCWMKSGKEFAASYSDGTIGVWNVMVNNKPDKLVTPYDASKKPAKDEPLGNYTFSPIKKLQWMNVKGNPYFVFTGGTPVGHVIPNTHVTLMKGELLSALPCSSVIVDFITVPSSPYMDAPQKPKVLLILCEEALVVFDISEVEKYNPQYNVPFVLDLHNPAVTSMEYVNECPDNLISSLHSCKSKKLVKEYSFKPWPFSGGKQGRSDKKFMSSDLIITGHCDGSVKFWHANSASLQPSITISTQHSFEKKPIPPSQHNYTGTPEKFRHYNQPVSTDKNTPTKTIFTSPVEFFPVSNVILNSVDWSLTVVNDGLCVMIYSFQPSKPSTAVKSLTVGLESSYPTESTGSHAVHTDSAAPNCGWRVLPEAPAASKGAGFYLQLCCQCVPPATNTSDDVVITSVEYSSKFGILVIGLTCGLVIVDTVECKCLLVEVNEFDFIAEALDNKKGWSWASKKGATLLPIGKKDGKKPKGDKQHQKAATLARIPVTVANQSDFDHMPVGGKLSAIIDQARDMAVNAEVMKGTINEKNNSTLCVNAVSIVELNIDKQSHTPTCCIWVGTDKGIVIMMAVNIESPATKHQPRALELSHRGIQHRLHHPVVSLSFLNDIGDIINTPSLHYNYQSLVNVAQSSNVTSAPEATATGDARMTTQYAVLCSEVLCKVYTFPDDSKLTMAELTDKAMTTIAKTETCHITGCPCLISLTFSGEILVHSLPSLRPVAVIPYSPLHDYRALRTFHVAANGSSAVYMYSPSEVQRLSLLKHNEADFANTLPELFVEVADPSSKRVLGSLFEHSMADRDKLFGENAGRPPRGVAETTAGIQTRPAGTSNFLSHATQALSERGQRLDDVVENTARMRDQAVVNEEAGKTLREKYTNQKWWKW